LAEAERTKGESSGLVGICVVLVGVVLLIVVIAAMFSTQPPSYPKRSPEEMYAPGDQFHRLQENVMRRFPGGLAETI